MDSRPSVKGRVPDRPRPSSEIDKIIFDEHCTPYQLHTIDVGTPLVQFHPFTSTCTAIDGRIASAKSHMAAHQSGIVKKVGIPVGVYRPTAHTGNSEQGAPSS